MIHRLWSRYPDIAPHLEAAQRLLAARAHLRVPAVETIVQTQIAAGGKMLRSGLMFMLARFHDADNPDLVTAAAAIEALHLATLIHDDVLDGAATRRGQATLQPTVGDRNAIYAGDLLFSVYFELLAQAAPNVRTVGVNARSMHRIFLGELDQNAQPPEPLSMPTVHRYLRQISGKTAALFALACYEGALLSGATRAEQQAAKRYGRLLGMAFQMTDDLLDLTGDDRLQKPKREDLQNSVATLPAIYALQADPSLLPLLVQAQTDVQVQAQAAARIIESGVPQAAELAARYTQKALAALAIFPDTAVKRDLLALTQALLARQQ
ncbi:polyprenyl synthetase family protein [Lacticaseibacillus mingshuiensis]|uniref:polyprenyl synthetase family protein n=1 Tax=Lacticaseibacillus mingshuiensis TaxID=2799574 RepID=UPI00195149FC|nr:polyprenyl synthetase family protein [Lacticaseibacillus mingshuiensis]